MTSQPVEPVARAVSPDKFSVRLRALAAALWARRNQASVHAALIVGLGVLVFANSLSNGFHLDDFYRVVNNPGIQQVSRPWVHFFDPSTMSTIDRITGYRPLLPLTLSIHYAISGDSVVSYHIGNLMLQLGAAWLVYLLVLRLLLIAKASAPAAGASESSVPDRGVALCVALLFAIHPVSGIPVNYICARDQLLSQLFWSGSLLVYLRMRQHGMSTRGWLLSLALLTCSLMSKGDAVAAPALVLCLEFTVFAEPLSSRRIWLRGLAFAIPVALLFVVQRALGYSETANVVSSNALSAWSYPLTQARLHLWRYLPHFFWPFPIRQDPLEPLADGVDLAVFAGLLFVAYSLVAAYRLRRSQPLLSFCILAYWIMLAPTSSIVPLHAAAVDYRPYPSSPYLFLGLCLVGQMLLRPQARRLVAAGAVAWCAATSVFLNQTWRTEQTLWQYSVDNGAGPLAHLNLAMATPELNARRQLLEQALAAAPDYILVLVNLGRTLVAQGHVDEGLAKLNRAVTLSPKDGQVRYWYAVTLSELKRVADANTQSTLAAKLDARNPQTVFQAVLAAQTIGQQQAALEWLDVLDRIDPNYPQGGFARGFALQQLGRQDDAIAAYRAFLVHYPLHVQARFNLGYGLAMTKHCAEAIPEFERVLKLDPTRAAAHYHLANCERAVGNDTVAQAHQERWDQSQHRR
jgi:protein O-mannosyl-transferase